MTKLSKHEISLRLKTLPNWELVAEHHLSLSLDFRDFKAALAFVNVVGGLAEELEHHPDIYLSWGKVRIELYTHCGNCISEKDFELAAAIDKAIKEPSN